MFQTEPNTQTAAEFVVAIAKQRSASVASRLADQIFLLVFNADQDFSGRDLLEFKSSSNT